MEHMTKQMKWRYGGGWEMSWNTQVVCCNTAKLWGNEQVRNLVETRKQLEKLIDVPWEMKKNVTASKRKAWEGSNANSVGRGWESREAKINSRKMNSRNNQKTMPGLSNKPIKPTEMPRAWEITLRRQFTWKPFHGSQELRFGIQDISLFLQVTQKTWAFSGTEGLCLVFS